MRNLWVHMTGPDRPGILGRLLDGVSDLGLELTDVEQVAVGDRLILAFAVDLPEHMTDAHEGLTFLARELGLTAELRNERRHPQRSDDLILVVTVLGEPVPARAMAAVGNTLAGYGANIRRIETLARRRLHCIEMLAVTDARHRKAVARDLLSVAARHDVDISVQDEGLDRRSKRLVVMDVDSTLIQGEQIDELATLVGAGEQVSRITHRAMNGELDFRGALRERVALLRGLPVDRLQEVRERLPYNPGVRSLVKVLREMGFRIAILSGGFTYFVDQFKQELGLDYAYANDLEVVDGKLTGETVGPIVDGQRKKELLAEIAESEGIRLDQVIAIGDGANDLPMMGIAGLGIAFNAKPRVREMAPHNINRRGLDSILFLLGIREEEIERVEAK
ncbi:MAG: phosphoserine phosphatase SerB [Nitrospirota bacterium]|nr:phosphoserine phosphatase SerB [Nitrospirota bacterium]